MSLLTLPDFNSSPYGQDSRRFADDTFRCILWMKRSVFWFKFPCSLFLKVRFTISQHWFWKGLVSKEATGLLGQHWPISMTHICATRGIRSDPIRAQPSRAQPSPARASRAEPRRAERTNPGFGRADRLGTRPSEGWAVRWATVVLTGGIFHNPVLG